MPSFGPDCMRCLKPKEKGREGAQRCLKCEGKPWPECPEPAAKFAAKKEKKVKKNG